MGPAWEIRARGADVDELVATRAIVATAVLVSCEEADPRAWAAPRDVWERPGWWEWADPTAKWWWRLDDVRTLAEPIPHQIGQLGLWTLPEETAVQLAETT